MSAPQTNSDFVLNLYSQNYNGTFTDCRRLSGDVNHTYLLTNSSGDKVVFQRLSKIFNKNLVEDFVVITEYLASEGWIVPLIILTKDQKPFIADEEGFIWRSITFVESDGTPKNVDMVSVGAILARFHKSLKNLRYQTKFLLEHYHDSEYYLQRLNAVMDEFDGEDHRLATEIESSFQKYNNLPEIEPQLIHADPRVGNLLFKGSKAFSVIDFDTIMTDTIWIELGDLIRSLVEADVINKTKTDVKILKDFTDAYLSNSGLSYDKDLFFKNCLLATQYMTFQLAMRFMVDIAEDYYFVWDSSKFPSRKDNHKIRIEQLFEVSRIIEEYNE